MKRVLVTGATGFIGRQSIPLLIEKGYEVHALGSSPATLPRRDERCYWHQADLLETGAAEDLMRRIEPTHLLHFAWFAKPGEYLESATNLAWVGASLRLLHAFAANGGQRFVGAGTCFEYDGRYGFCREDLTPTRPSSLYGTCKEAFRSILEAYGQRAGIGTAWGRIFFLYGEHEYPVRLVASVIRSLLRGEEARCSAGTQIRDFMHVQDVAGGFVALLDSAVPGTVNICSGRPIQLRELIGAIAAQLDADQLVRLGALPMRPNEPPMIAGDATRLTEEVGYRPALSLEQGLTRTIEWWARTTNQDTERKSEA